MIQDCPGQRVFSCTEVGSLAKRIEEAPTTEDSDWASYVATEIRKTVLTRATEFGITNVDVKCSDEGCVLLVESEHGRTLFAKGIYPHQRDEFETLVNQSSWAPEFIGTGIDSNAASIMAWRVTGFDLEPELVWYVLKRKD
jgi:hypothetical protein